MSSAQYLKEYRKTHQEKIRESNRKYAERRRKGIQARKYTISESQKNAILKAQQFPKDPRAKRVCVGCEEYIDHKLYLQNGNWCPKCLGRTARDAYCRKFTPEIKEVKEKHHIEHHPLTGVVKKTFNIKDCPTMTSPECSGKYVPTKLSPLQCLHCFRFNDKIN